MNTSLSLEQVFAQQDAFSYPQVYTSAISGELAGYFYLQACSDNGKNYQAILWQSIDANSQAVTVTHSEFNIGTHFSEYGGKAFWLFGQTLYFSNIKDNHLYKLSFNETDAGFSFGEACRISETSNQTVYYTNLIELDEQSVLVTAEHEAAIKSENQTCLRVLDVQQKTSLVLAQGADFYSNLVISEDKSLLAWVQWQHPNMPWDDTQLVVAQLAQTKGKWHLEKQLTVPFDSEVSICQLAFAANNRLFFVADYRTEQLTTAQKWQDFWNIHVVDTDQIFTSKSVSVNAVTKLTKEFGYPHWQYGNQRIARLDQRYLLAFATDDKGDSLYRIDTHSLACEQLNEHIATLHSLHSDAQGYAACLAYPNARPTQMILLNQNGFVKTLREQTAVLDEADVSLAQAICFPTRDGQEAYGYYYPPHCSKGKPAPLIVMVHGGPTSRCYGYFDKQKQFWTHNGFAVFDVNHRGSVGYGRRFREALYGHWGEIDASDVVDGIDYLIAQNKVDENKICIRGKSAGGYAVLRCLTEYPEVFCAGACYYGIGNLVTLSQLTHKFEKYYTDALVAQTFNLDSANQSSSAFYQRSPIHKMNQVKSAMIIFQGSEDHVVPPAVAHEVVDVLKQNNVVHDYVEYQGEGHGFKQLSTNIDAWSKELNFYQKVMNDE